MSSNTENIPPQVIKRILKEINEINNENLDGIKLIPNEQDICDIQAFIEGPADTPYFGGMFRLKLILCKGFPAQPPKAYFITKIFHPNVASNGEICVNTLKKDWKPELGIKHILITVKCLLIVPNPESALNEEAGKLLLEDYDEYASRAKLYTETHAKNKNQSLSYKSSCYQSTDSLAAQSSSSLTSVTPLDANKTIHTTSSNSNGSSDEPNCKMAKLQSVNVQQQQSQKEQEKTKKMSDKKKALKRL